VENLVRFGINLPNFGLGTTPESIARWAARAEQAGFDLLMVSDHVAQTPDVQAGFPGPFYDPLAILIWLAPQTNQIALGTSVLVLPYRHPLLTARLTTNLDQFSGGRLVLGIGAGWSAREFTALGVPYAHRGRLTDEYLEVLQRLWTQPATAYHGAHVAFSEVASSPRPARRPPIWVGGHARLALRRAVRYGDAWHPTSVSVAWIRHQALPELRCLADAERRPMPVLAPRIKLRITDSPLAEHDRRAGEGTLEQIRTDLEALVELGATHIVFDTTVLGQPRPLDQDDHDWVQIAQLTTKLIDLNTHALR
jgi:probable F420-dependent oxidoreductase